MATMTKSARPSRLPADDRGPSGVGIRAGRLLSGAVAALVAASSLAGLLIGDLYQDPESVVAMLRGYDLAALVVAVPVLAVTLAPSLYASRRGRLVTAGVLAFVVYDYAYYVFGTVFNDLFLLHVATFSAATFALILVLSSLDVNGAADWLRPRTPAAPVAVILGVLAASLAGMWVVGAVRFALDGTIPDDGNALVYPIELTHLGYAMDLAFLVPGYTLAAVLLWRRRPWGYVLGVVMLIAGAFTQLSYMAALVFQARADIPGAAAVDPFAPVILAVYLIGTGLLLTDPGHGPRTRAAAVRRPDRR